MSTETDAPPPSFLAEYVDGLARNDELAPGGAEKLMSLFKGHEKCPPPDVARAVSAFLEGGSTAPSYRSAKPADPTKTPIRAELERHAGRLRPGVIPLIEAELVGRSYRTRADVAALVAEHVTHVNQRGYLANPRPLSPEHRAIVEACQAFDDDLHVAAPERLAAELWLEVNRQRLGGDLDAIRAMIGRRLARQDAGKFTLSGRPIPLPERPAPPPEPERLARPEGPPTLARRMF